MPQKTTKRNQKEKQMGKQTSQVHRDGRPEAVYGTIPLKDVFPRDIRNLKIG
jgi:ribosomal protein S14